MNSSIDQELDLKIKLLIDAKQNQEFLRHLKVLLEYQNLFDVSTTEKRIYQNVLPAIKDQFGKIYSDNMSLFETLEDEIISVLIKENLEVAFELIETVQEMLNFIYQHSPVNVNDIKSILKCIPSCVLLFTDHWKKSSEAYKNAFIMELSKLLEVIKYLYVSFSHILQYSVSIQESNDDLSSIVEALTFITQYDLDEGAVISRWKCFATIIVKNSTELEDYLDIRIPINTLCEDIYRALNTLSDHDVETFQNQLQTLTFLIKTLFKLTDTFYQQLEMFAQELFIFYVKILSLGLDHFKSRDFATEALIVIDTEVFKKLDVFLQHLVMGQSQFKNNLEKISDYIESNTVFNEHPFGMIILLSKILHMVAASSSDWCFLTIKFTEVIFNTLPLCHKELFLDQNDSSTYQQLIVHISAAILVQDASFQSAELLLRHILQEDVYAAILATEIYTLVVGNLSSEDCLSLLINLLYGVNDLLCGFFTHRPEMVFLKKLLQRIFKILPDALKDAIIKLFSPDQFIQIWRFLGFGSLPTYQTELLLNPVIENTSNCIKSIQDICSEDMPLNIAEGLNLCSTVNSLDTNDPRLKGVVNFLNIFWKSAFDCDDILNNNIMKYFVLKIAGITSSFMQNSNFDSQMVFTKLKTLSSKDFYWVAVFKIIHSILNSLSSLNIQEISKQHILSQVANIINISIQNKSNLHIQETYLDMLKNLNESQKDMLNMLLDTLNPNIAGQVFGHLDKCSGRAFILLDHRYNNISFRHQCLTWNDCIDVSISPQIKRARTAVFASQPVKTQNSIKVHQAANKIRKVGNSQINYNPREDLRAVTPNGIEDDSSAAEVIGRIKGEIKCLMKVCNTEKLTQKNKADLRILMSQLSSLM